MPALPARNEFSAPPSKKPGFFEVGSARALKFVSAGGWRSTARNECP
jgi:hypothetical protein